MSKTIRVSELTLLNDYILRVKEITGVEITESQSADTLIRLGAEKAKEIELLAKRKV